MLGAAFISSPRKYAMRPIFSIFESEIKWSVTSPLGLGCIHPKDVLYIQEGVQCFKIARRKILPIVHQTGLNLKDTSRSS